MKTVLLLMSFLAVFCIACKKEVAVTSAMTNAGTIITDSSTIDPPARRNLTEERAQ